MRIKGISTIVIICLLFLCCLSGCQTKTTPKTGALDVSSYPPGADVYLDSQYRGTTPLKITDVSMGTHTVELRLSGYENWTTSGTMDEGGSAHIEASLYPVTPTPIIVPSSFYPNRDVRGRNYTYEYSNGSIFANFDADGKYNGQDFDSKSRIILYFAGTWTQSKNKIAVKYIFSSNPVETMRGYYPYNTTYSCLDLNCHHIIEDQSPWIIYEETS